MTDVTSTPITVIAVGLDKVYRRAADVIHAVRQASFTLEPAEVTVLAGPSGSGKTTLLNLILGWEKPDGGAIEGVPRAPTWADLAVVPQSLGLLPALTIAENVTLPSRVATARRDHRELMEVLGIAHLADRFPDETSLGEQQRTAIARALLTQPRLLILDEPTSHQDEDHTQLIIDQLIPTAGTTTTVLIATHDDRVIAHGTRHLAIADGLVTTTTIAKLA